jgi:biotin carboxylase
MAILAPKPFCMPYKNALLLDAGFSAAPLIACLNRQSYWSMSMGARALDPGHALAREAVIADYSDQAAVLALCKTRKIEHLIPGVTDVAYLTGACVAEKLGFSGFDPLETAQRLIDKQAFRLYAQSKGFPVPKMADTPEAAETLGFPLMVKPVDAYSGLGLEKIMDRKGLRPAFANARRYSKKQMVIAEEFVEGSLHSHSAFLRAGGIARDFFVDEFCTVYPWAVNCSHLSRALPETLKKTVRECITDLARDLRLVDGLLHTQFIFRRPDFSLIEITRRYPGDLYGRLIQKSCGFSYFAAYLQPFLPASAGEDFDLRRAGLRHIARHTVSRATEGGTYAGVRLRALPTQARLLDVVSCKPVGEPVRAAPHDRAAVAFLEFRREDALLTETALLAQYFDILELETL